MFFMFGWEIGTKHTVCVRMWDSAISIVARLCAGWSRVTFQAGAGHYSL